MIIRTIEEYWPGQKDDLRTARIEVWLEGEHWPTEVGRITADKEIFDQVRDAIENESEHSEVIYSSEDSENWKERWEL